MPMLTSGARAQHRECSVNAHRPVAAVYLVGALDTKGAEYAFVRDRICERGVPVRVVDSGVLGVASLEADVDRVAVAGASGHKLSDLLGRADRAHAIEVMANGAAAIVRQAWQAGELSGVLVLGGSNAGYVMSRVSVMLPIGVPKLLVSTIVAGDTTPYVGTSDLMMLNPVVDLAGVNSISAGVLARAADAMVGMVSAPEVPVITTSRAVIAATMFGVTTGCVSGVQGRLLAQGDEVQVFHATGVGGRTMEALIDSGAFDVVADVTTTELVDSLLGGVCSAGPHRLEAAGRRGVPQIVSVGAVDMCNFGPMDSVPEKFRERQLLSHNPAVTLMRTSPDENRAVGRALAGKLNAARGYVELHIPTQGFSQISGPGGPFHDPNADTALIAAVQEFLRSDISLTLHDVGINDPSFAAAIAAGVERGLQNTKGK